MTTPETPEFETSKPTVPYFTVTYFTFGTIHSANLPLPHRNKTLADYWVEVYSHNNDPAPRETFMEHFTKKYCPSPTAFAFEYDEESFKPPYFPGGCLARVTRHDLILRGPNGQWVTTPHSKTDTRPVLQFEPKTLENLQRLFKSVDGAINVQFFHGAYVPEGTLQEPDFQGVDLMWVSQHGPGMAGDDFEGLVTYKVGDWYIVIEFMT